MFSDKNSDASATSSVTNADLIDTHTTDSTCNFIAKAEVVLPLQTRITLYCKQDAYTF